jgi:hypothetical protein
MALGCIWGGVVKPLGWVICPCVDRLNPWWIGTLMEKLTFTRVNLSNIRVIMVIMRVLVEELLCQAVMGRFQHLSACCQVRVHACGYVLSCLALNGATSQ